MKSPSVKTLSKVFDNPKRAKQILCMSRSELLQTEGGKARDAECWHAPKTYDLRMHALNAIDAGLHGVESAESVNGEYAEYLNTGDTYAPTLIYWRGNYRVQSLGDFIETMQRNNVGFK